MPTYKQLNQRHPSIDPKRDELLLALYEGGERLEKLYPDLLKKRPRERDDHHRLRLTEAEYRNYLGPIIDYFRSMLFLSRPVLKAKAPGAAEPTANPGEYWNELREDADGGGTDLDALFAQVLTDAMVTRVGWLRLHIPTDGGDAPTDLADFEARGLGDAWLEHLENGRLLDWDADQAGRLRWAIVHEKEQRRLSIADDRSTVVETWEVLTPEGVDTYQIAYKANAKPTDETDIPLVKRTPNRFGAVPLVCLELKPALWIGNRLKSPQLALLRKVSAQNWSLAATAYAMPVAKVDSPEDYQKQVTGASYEIVIGKDEDWGWEAPPSDHFDSYDREIKTTKDEIFRVAHQMAMGVDNNAAAVGRTAESKASDHEITRVVLAAFSRKVKETIEYTLDLISTARGEKLEWSVEGLDDFAGFDIGAFLVQLGLVNEKAGGIPSETFQIQAKTRIAEALLKDVDEGVKAQIRQEIKAGVENEPDEVDAEIDRAVRMHQALNGEEPPKPAKRPGTSGRGESASSAGR